MKKLSLKLDELAVESFPTTREAAPELGTVHGAMAPTNTGGNCATCRGETCFTSCPGGGGDPACTCPIQA